MMEQTTFQAAAADGSGAPCSQFWLSLRSLLDHELVIPASPAVSLLFATELFLDFLSCSLKGDLSHPVSVVLVTTIT